MMVVPCKQIHYRRVRRRATLAQRCCAATESRILPGSHLSHIPSLLHAPIWLYCARREQQAASHHTRLSTAACGAAQPVLFFMPRAMEPIAAIVQRTTHAMVLVLAVVAWRVAVMRWSAVGAGPVAAALGAGHQVGRKVDVRQLAMLVEVPATRHNKRDDTSYSAPTIPQNPATGRLGCAGAACFAQPVPGCVCSDRECIGHYSTLMFESRPTFERVFRLRTPNGQDFLAVRSSSPLRDGPRSGESTALNMRSKAAKPRGAICLKHQSGIVKGRVSWRTCSAAPSSRSCASCHRRIAPCGCKVAPPASGSATSCRCRH